MTTMTAEQRELSARFEAHLKVWRLNPKYSDGRYLSHNGLTKRPTLNPTTPAGVLEAMKLLKDTAEAWKIAE